MGARCRNCNGVIVPPAELDATTMRCGYCGLDQPVPDLAERRAALAERERRAREAEDRAREAAREAEKRREKARDRSDRRWSRLGSWISTLVAMLSGEPFTSRRGERCVP